MPDRDVLDDDVRDEDARDAPGIERRLEKTLRLQQRVTGRLNAIISVSASPGPPDGPTLCDSIIAEAQATITAATSLKRTFTGPS